jgi:alpha-L-rhamnosidase
MDHDIVDWPVSQRDDYEFLPVNTVVNALSYRCLSDMAEIAAHLGRVADADLFGAVARRLRTAINERLYDAVTGAYVDGLKPDGMPSMHHAAHASLFPLALGVAGDEQRAAVVHLARRGPVYSVYAAALALPALVEAGRTDDALELIVGASAHSWANMLRVGAGACMEAWDLSDKPNSTYSHPWAASPADSLVSSILGVRPTGVGFESFDVRPRLGRLEWASASVPTPFGPIVLHVSKRRVVIDVPHRTGARVFVPGTSSPVMLGPGHHEVAAMP